MENLYERAKVLLDEYNQSHLLMFYNKLNKKQQKELLNQILNIDFNNIQNLYNNIGNQVEKDKEVEPIEYIDKYKIQKDEYEKYKKVGQEELSKGKLAVITMAGGQGTRLRT